jgi:hypothetical protein
VTKLWTQWTVILAGPLTWLACLEASYALVPWTCRTGHRSVVILVVLGALAGTLGMAGAAWVGWRTLGARDTTDGDPPAGRRAFMALSGLALSLFSALALMASAVPIFVLSPCD